MATNVEASTASPRYPARTSEPGSGPGVGSGRPGRRYDARVGSKGSKPRKPSHSQHLNKVGTHADARYEQHEEREAIEDVMGLQGLAPWLKMTIVVVAALLFIAGIWAFLFAVVI